MTIQSGFLSVWHVNPFFNYSEKDLSTSKQVGPIAHRVVENVLRNTDVESRCKVMVNLSVSWKENQEMQLWEALNITNSRNI